MCRNYLASHTGGWVIALFQRQPVTKILRISRVVADLERSETFYRDGLGFARISCVPGNPALASLLGLPNAASTELVMRLGREEVAFVRFDPQGVPYPVGSQSNDCWFQHLAIVVADMPAAYRRLSTQVFKAISTGGPQTLPPSDGKVVAFKFRDPDGHPLELIEFPPGQGRPTWHTRGVGPFLGIDHSAMSIRKTYRAIRFYRHLGFKVASRSLNHGPAQARLDGLGAARVRVTGLRPSAEEGPGLELLGYIPPGRPMPNHMANACITDWITVQTDRLSQAHTSVRRDPDGHIILLVGGGQGTTCPAAGPLT